MYVEMFCRVRQLLWRLSLRVCPYYVCSSSEALMILRLRYLSGPGFTKLNCYSISLGHLYMSHFARILYVQV